MAKGIKELRSRVKSIKSTKKITRAMEMVSAAKLRRSQDAMNAARPFTRKLEGLLARLAQSPTAVENPLFQVRPETADSPSMVVLFTSDRGLCGAFNTNLIKMAQKYLEEHPHAVVYAVGKKGRDAMRRRYKNRLVGEKVDLGGKLSGPVTDAIANELLEKFMTGKVSGITLVAPHFVSTASNYPEMSRYLPLEPSAFGEVDTSGKSVDYLLEPSPERVFEALLPRYLRSKIHVALAETFASEHASRMLAMNNATKNCDELGNKLTLEMNKARQAGITTEILEIVSGAEALAG